MDNEKQTKYQKRTEEEHGFTHFLLLLILIINLATLCLAYSNYLSHQYVLEELNGVHHTKFQYIDD